MKRAMAALLLPVLMFMLCATAAAGTLALRFSLDETETMRMTVTGRTMRIYVTDIEAYSSFNLTLKGEKEYNLTAQTSESRSRADFSLSEIPDGNYKVRLFYSAADSSLLKPLTPATLTLTVGDGGVSFDESPTLAGNLELKSEADASETAMKFYKYYSSTDEVSDLAQSLTATAEGDYAKARNVYDWVCANVYLDVDAMYSGQPVVTAEQVVSSKIATSKGFAAVTAQLLRASGIAARTVNGIGAVNLPSIWNDNNPTNDTVEQFWVEAYIDGRWLNIDTALGTGNTVVNGRKIRGTVETRLYFDSTDDFFAYTHSASEYETAPEYYGAKSITTTALTNGASKTAKALGLPEKIEANTSMGTLLLAVKWDVSGCSYDPDKTGAQTFTVRGEFTLPEVFAVVGDVKKTVETSVTVNARVLTGVTISSAAEQTVCFAGDSVDTDGLTLKLEYDNGKTENKTSGFDVVCDTAEPGEKTVEVSFEGFTVTYSLRVLSITPQLLELTEPMTKTGYYVGDTIDLSGLVLRLCYEAGYKFDAHEYTIDYDFSESGERTVTFTCEGVSVTQTVSVESVVATHMTVVTMPERTEFTLGSEPDLTGLAVEVAYNNGSIEVLTDGFETEYEALMPGDVTVKIVYKGVSTTVTLTAIEQPSEQSEGVESNTAESEETEQGNGATVWIIVLGGIVLAAALAMTFVVLRKKYAGMAERQTRRS